MIDPDNLRTASLYINNQLLSRGLLRDGQNIDFADPEGSDGGLETAMGRIISIVNDLILRRDRDAEHRESLSSTLRTLRTDAQRQATEYARQTEKLEDTQRRLDTAEATERALRAQLKTAEQGIHKLKDEMAKMKSVVAQTRNACANEVRKRDRHIDSLKKAVADAGRVRGGGRNRDVITINVTGDVGSEGDEGRGMPVGATEDEGYSLRMETNGFLTELAKGLSEENEGLLALAQRTINGLREMSGLDRGTNAGDEEIQNNSVRNGFVEQLPQKSADDLAAELEAIVEHLRSILTNPSFVPIEEVELRDQEIAVLRAGLKTIEARWKDTMLMIDGWRRRMASSGKSVDMEDLQLGLRLSPVRVRDVVEESANAVEPMRLSCVQEEEEEEEDKHQIQKNQDDNWEAPLTRSQSSAGSLRLVPAPRYDDEEELDDDSDSESSIFQDDLDDDLDMEEPNVQILQMSTADSIDSSPLPEPPKISPLKASYSSGNRGAAVQQTSPYHKQRPGDFSTIVEENTWDFAAADEEKERPAPISPSQKSAKSFKSPISQVEVDEDGMPIYTASYDSPLFGKSGERPTEADLNRKLFSKPSEPRPRSTAIGTILSQISPPAAARTTRSSAKKTAETSPVSNPRPAIRAVVDTKEDTVPSTTTTTSSNTSTHTTEAATAATTTKKQTAPKNASTKPSTTTTNAAKKERDSKPNRTRSPTRAQPTATALTAAATTAPTPASSRLPRRHAQQQKQQQQQQNPLNMATIAAKLAASEREADAARVRAKLRAVRRSRRISGKGVEDSTPATVTAQAQEQTDEPSETAAMQPAENTENATTADLSKEDVDPVKKEVHSNSNSNARENRSETREIEASMKKAPKRRLSRAPVSDDVDELGNDYISADGDDDGDLNMLVEEGEEEQQKDEIRVVKHRKITRERGNNNKVTARAGKVASRRRSTLSPWELQGLISGKVEKSPGREREVR